MSIIGGVQAKRIEQIEMATHEKIHKIYVAHCEHPEYTKRELRMVTGQTPKMINRYWDMFVEVKHEIKEWNEVM